MIEKQDEGTILKLIMKPKSLLYIHIYNNDTLGQKVVYR